MSEFNMKLEPAERLPFTSKKLGEEPTSAPLKLINTGSDRYAFKVKCTSNELFRIRPPIGFIRPGDSSTVQLTFNAGKSVPDSGKHYAAVYYIKVPDDKKGTARQAWQEHKGDPHGTKRVYIEFNKEGAEKKDEKKEEDKKEEKKEDKKDDDKKEDKKEDAGDKKEEGEKKDEDKKEEKKDDEKKDDDKKDEKKDDGGDKKDEEKKEEEKKE